jgi:uncharacterized protein (DUF1501 family)
MTIDPTLSRRRFLQLAAIAGGATAAPFVVDRALSGGEATPSAEPAGSTMTAVGDVDAEVTAMGDDGPEVRDGERILVVVHLDGGNDGLNTVVPLDDPLYAALRGAGATPIEDVHPLDASYGLASMPYLAERWAADEVAIVHGVGVTDGTLSHFAASDIWEGGSLDPSTFSGWLGRAIEHRFGSDADPLVGVAAGSFSRALMGDLWTPFTLPTAGSLPWSQEFITNNEGLVAGLEALSAQRADGLAGQVLESHDLLREVGERIDAARPDDDALQNTGRRDGIANDLAVVADVINADLGTRVFHVRHRGFDTHANQLATHPGLLSDLDTALAQFDARLGDKRDEVVVMTWTEFGRRVAFNGSGTDHGTSSVGLVVGSSVVGGHHGDAPDLGNLDRAGNQAVTTDFRDYLAGVCGPALGVPADVITEQATPVEVLT